MATSLLHELRDDEEGTFKLLKSIRGDVGPTNEIQDGGTTVSTLAACVRQDRTQLTASFGLEHHGVDKQISAINPPRQGCDQFWTVQPS